MKSVVEEDDDSEEDEDKAITDTNQGPSLKEEPEQNEQSFRDKSSDVVLGVDKKNDSADDDDDDDYSDDEA